MIPRRRTPQKRPHAPHKPPSPLAETVKLLAPRDLRSLLNRDTPARQRAVVGLLAMGIPVLTDAVVKLLVGSLRDADEVRQQAALASLREIGCPAIQPLAE